MAKKYCKNCGNEYEGNKGSKYCSEKCAFDDGGYLIDTETGCWNWQGRKDNKGYGRFFFNNKNIFAHRFACESVQGKAPEGKNHALHGCDNPGCVNPDHLRWGDQKENIEDKTDRDRQAKGEKQGKSKLKNEDVIDIKEKLTNYSYGDFKKLAEEYNVVPSAIRDIHNGITWTHI